MRSFDCLDGLYWCISIIYARKVQMFVSLGLRQNAETRSTDLLLPSPAPLLTTLKFTGNNNDIKIYIKADLANEEIIFKYRRECISAYIARISRAINFHMRYIVCTFIERHFSKKITSQVLTGKKVNWKGEILNNSYHKHFHWNPEISCFVYF